MHLTRSLPSALLFGCLCALAGNALADRPKIGLVLSGGGARGAAHIGVLRVLEEQRIDEEGRTLTEDQSIFWSDELSESMRYAEDATREMRSMARDLSDAYDDAREIADNDKVDDISQEESDRIYNELRRARIEVRAACEVILAAAAAESGDTANNEETGS